MNVLLGSNVVSTSDILWILFLVFGLPALLLIGVVILIILAVRKRKE
jgi:hypothetical protein